MPSILAFCQPMCACAHAENKQAHGGLLIIRLTVYIVSAQLTIDLLSWTIGHVTKGIASLLQLVLYISAPFSQLICVLAASLGSKCS